MAPVVQHTGGGGASTAAAAVAGSKQQARPFHKRTAVRLIIGALVCLSLLGFILFTPGSHDADWWKHAGIKAGPRDKATTVGNPVMYGDDGVVFNNANQPTLQQQQAKADSVLAHDEKNNKATAAVVARTPSPPGPKVFQPLVAGRDYYADYNIDTIKLDPEPPMAPGRKPLFNYVEPSLHPEYAMKYVSNAPRILVIQNFLSPEECDAIIATASKSLFRSQVAPTINSKDSAVQDVRTSSQAWLHAGSEPARPIVERIIKLAGFPPGSNEELQVLKYDLSQKYDAHNDYFDPKMYGPQATNRALTTFLYLSDVEEGGETQFPRADGKPPTFDFTSCTKGLRVRPKRGMAVMFYDMKPNGELDPYSLHGGCPVKKGVKWGGTLWLRMPTPKS